MSVVTELAAEPRQKPYHTPAIAPKLSPVRLTLTGGGTTAWDVQYPAGTSLRKNGAIPCGYNLGVFEYYSKAEAATLAARLYSEGVRLVRLVMGNRWTGSPGKGIGDSRTTHDNLGNKTADADSCYNMENAANFEKLEVYVEALTALGIWVIIPVEGDILTNGGVQDTAWDSATGLYDPTTGTYDRALTLVQPGETIPGGLADWGLAGGYNAYTSKFLFGRVRENVKRIARRFRGTPNVWAYELASEPFVPSGKFDSTHSVPPNRTGPPYFIYPGDGAGNYPASWVFSAGNPNAVAYLGGASTGAPNGALSLEDYYRILITDVMGDAATGKPAIDPNTPFIYGGPGGYNLDPEGAWITAALSDSAGPNALGGDLRAKNKIFFTWDRLGAGTNQCTKSPNTAWVASKLLVHLYMNQAGERNGGDGDKDPGDGSTFGCRHLLRTYQQFGIGSDFWDRRANGPPGYGSEYSSGGADPNGANGSYTDVEPRRTDLANTFAERGTLLEADAIAAANASHGVLVYIKRDLSNVYDETLTVWTGRTPVIGTSKIGKILPVTDPDATNIVFTLAASGTMTFDYPWKDGSNVSYLPDALPSMFVDNVADAGHNSYLVSSQTFFATAVNGATASGAEDWAAMFAGMPTANNTAMTMIFAGNSGSTVLYPKLAINSTTFVQSKVFGNGTNLGKTLTGTNTGAYVLQHGVPLVCSIIKSGASRTAAALTMFVNGIDDTGQVPVVVPPYKGSATGETIAGTDCTVTGITVGDGTSMNMSRTRIFASSNTGDWVGTCAGFCLWRGGAPTADQVRRVGRWLAYIQGGGYKA